jgi:hypothetical protein
MSNSHPYQHDYLSVVSSYRQRCFNCPYDDCGASARHMSKNLQLHPTMSTFFLVTCDHCTRNWYVCTLCQGQQLPLLSEKSATKHIFNQHRTPKAQRKAAPTSTSPASTTPSSVASPPRRNPSRHSRVNFASPMRNSSNVVTSVSTLLNDSPLSQNGIAMHLDDDDNVSSGPDPSLYHNNNSQLHFASTDKSSLSEFNKFVSDTIEHLQISNHGYYQFNPRSSAYYANVTDNHYKASSQIIAKANSLNQFAIKKLTNEETKQQMLKKSTDRFHLLFTKFEQDTYLAE